jgi:uncharacterized glyoxalase superfamily protein PhnB
MTVQPIPPGYHTITPYLIVSGLPGTIAFLEKVFDAKTTVAPMRRPDGTIMHTELQIGDSRIMMAEATEQWKPMPASIFLYVTNCDASYKRALEGGASSLMEPADQFYGDRMGGVLDLAGNQWWVATHIEDVSPEEMDRRKAGYLAAQTVPA